MPTMKGHSHMRKFSLIWHWQGFHLATRHALILVVLGVLFAWDMLGSSSPSVFAYSQKTTEFGIATANLNYVAIARQDARVAGIPPDTYVRQIAEESGFNPRAVSRAGAIGIAQFMPATAASLRINPWNPIQSLRGAARLMASYVRQYGGNYAKALAAYNAGSGAVQSAVRRGGAKWYFYLPAETQNYIRIIMR
jgi:soluble lytic murein transglycosylase-like protein